MGRRGRRCKQLLNDFKVKKGYYALYVLLFLEKAMDLSQDRLRNELISVVFQHIYDLE
jgi:hypothetical protein